MIEPPFGPSLLEVARQTLMDELLPVIPSEKRYAALMVANAIAIAARGAGCDAAAGEALDTRARALAGAGSGDPWRALSSAVRAGRFDAGTPLHDAAFELLRDYADARCAISSPKARRTRPA